MTVEEVGGLGDHHGGGHQRAGVVLENDLASLVMGVVGVRGGDQDAGIDQQHSVSPETLGQQIVGLSAAAGLAGGGADGHERQVPTQTTSGTPLGKAGRKSLGGQLVDADPAPGGLGGQTVDQLVGQMPSGHDHPG